MTQALRRLARAFAIAGGLCASAVALMTVLSIIGRSMLRTPVPGDVELTQLGIAWAISLCLPWCQLHGGNIIVDFFTQRAGARARRAMDAAGCVLLALMAALLAWRTAAGALAVHGAGETSMILGMPGWWVYAGLAPGLALSGAIALVQAMLHASGRGVEAMR